jgi:type II secretory pathway pseudopilin PulG
MLELVLVVILVVVLYVLAIDRILPLRGDAEAAHAAAVAGSLRSALGMEVADRVLRESVTAVRGVDGMNPMRLLAEQPDNYLGEVDGVRPERLQAGHWYFDRSTGELVYLVRHAQYFRTDLPGPPRLVFRTELVYNERDELAGARLARVNTFVWTQSADTAALLGCALLTGAGAVLSTARVEPGESVAVLGLGGVGLCAVMGAAIAGAYPIVAIDPVAAKRELALELGATHALDSGGIGDAIVEILPDGVDHAIEAVGAAAVLADAWSITARGGTTVAVGLPHPSQQLSVPIVALVGEARRLLGSYLGGAVPERDIPRFVELWRAGRLPLERLHSASLGLDGLNRALDDLHEGRALRQIVHPTT